MFFVIGSNMTEAHPVAATFLKNALRKGAELFVADPRHTDLASRATVHLPLRVGSDIALLNAIMNVLINEDIYDKEYVANAALGFDELKAKVMEYTPESGRRHMRHRRRRRSGGWRGGSPRSSPPCSSIRSASPSTPAA